MITVGWHRRPTDAVRGAPWCETTIVFGPDCTTVRLDRVELLELRSEERCEDLRGKIAGPHVHPPVPVDLTTKELAAVRALLSDDLGSSKVPGVVEEQRATLAALDVLGLVKALCGHRADGAKA